jgi:hypothetical protein
MTGCNFKEQSVFFGYKFDFTMRNFGNYKVRNFKVSIQFKWGAGFLGSKDPRKIISDLALQCKKRQEDLLKQKIAEEMEKERKRIKGEEMRKAEEAIKKKAEAEAATKQKAALDAAQKRAEEEVARKKAEDEAKKKAEEEITKQEAAAILKEKETKDAQKTDQKEKEFLEISNMIKAKYNVGFGNALYITGEDPILGSWNKAFKMNPIKADEWVFKSSKIKDGMKFKTIIYNWVNEDNINVEALKSSNQLRWENNQGSEGNKSFLFAENLMVYTPGFNRRRRMK